MERINNYLNPVRKNEEIVSPTQRIIKEAEVIKIDQSDRNKEGLLLTPEGKISHYQNELNWKMIKTEAFKEWFGDSVVKYYDNQEPVTVFHSTLKREMVGLNLKLNEKADDWNSYGIYFSSNKKATIDFYSTQYKDDTERFERLLNKEIKDKDKIVLSKEKYLSENEDMVKTFGAFIKIEKPLRLNSHEELMEISWAGFNRQELLKEHDGIIINYDNEFSDQYIVFKEDDVLILPSELS